MQFEGCIAVVTGAGAGIGLSTAREIARAGSKVVISDVRPEALERARLALSEQGADFLCVQGDVASEDDVVGLCAAAQNHFGPVSIWINNAGVGKTTPLLEAGLEEWQAAIEVNLTGAFLGSRTAARAMVKSGTRGAILNISSISAQRAGTGRGCYGASKAGVELLTKAFAIELGEHGIRVNAIAPGPVDTELARSMHDDRTRQEYARKIPLGRYGREEEVAHAALFMVSPRTTWITGHILNVDGGFNAAGLILSELRNGVPARATDSSLDA